MYHIRTRFLFEILLFACIREKSAFPTWDVAIVKKTSSYLAKDRFSVVGIKVCKKSSFQLIEKIVICEKNFEVVLLHDFVHLRILIRPHILSQLAMALDLLWKGLNIPISSVNFVIKIMLVNVFNSPNFCQHYYNFCSFLLFHFLLQFLLSYCRYHRQSYLRTFLTFAKDQNKI